MFSLINSIFAFSGGNLPTWTVKDSLCDVTPLYLLLHAYMHRHPNNCPPFFESPRAVALRGFLLQGYEEEGGGEAGAVGEQWTTCDPCWESLHTHLYPSLPPQNSSQISMCDPPSLINFSCRDKWKKDCQFNFDVNLNLDAGKCHTTPTKRAAPFNLWLENVSTQSHLCNRFNDYRF